MTAPFFIKIGLRYINLASVTTAEWDKERACLTLFYDSVAADGDGPIYNRTDFMGDEAAELAAYLDALTVPLSRIEAAPSILGNNP